MSPSPFPLTVQRKNLLRAAVHIGLGATAVLTVVFLFGCVYFWSSSVEKMDFRVFHETAVNLKSGVRIYEPIQRPDSLAGTSQASGTTSEFIPNLNPPFQAVLFFPIGFLTLQSAYLAWAWISLIAGTLGAILIPLELGAWKDKVAAGFLFANLCLVYFPTYVSLSFGQWSLFPFLFLVLAWSSWRKGKFVQAGGILGAIAAVKLFFGAFLLFFLARKDWRGAVSFLMSFAVLTGASILIVGADSMIQFFGVLGSIKWLSSSWNASVVGFISRVFGEPGNVPLIHAPGLSWFLGKALPLGGIFLLAWMATRRSKVGNRLALDDLAFSGCVVIMLLVSPLGWIYYFPFLLIPLSVIWAYTRDLPNGRVLRLLTVLAWVLSSVPRGQVRPEALNGDPFVILAWSGAYFYALILFLVLIWALQNRLLQEETSPVVAIEPAAVSSA